MSWYQDTNTGVSKPWLDKLSPKGESKPRHKQKFLAHSLRPWSRHCLRLMSHCGGRAESRRSLRAQLGGEQRQGCPQRLKYLLCGFLDLFFTPTTLRKSDVRVFMLILIKFGRLQTPTGSKRIQFHPDTVYLKLAYHNPEVVYALWCRRFYGGSITSQWLIKSLPNGNQPSLLPEGWGLTESSNF